MYEASRCMEAYHKGEETKKYWKDTIRHYDQKKVSFFVTNILATKKISVPIRWCEHSIHIKSMFILRSKINGKNLLVMNWTLGDSLEIKLLQSGFDRGKLLCFVLVADTGVIELWDVADIFEAREIASLSIFSIDSFGCPLLFESHVF